MAALAQEVGGDRVEVDSIARGYQDPHFVEAKPSFLLLLRRADLLVVVGLQLEIGWLPPLITQSGNPRIQVSAPGYLDGKPGSREKAGLIPGPGPAKVVTNLGIYSFRDGEMVLDSIHSKAGITLEDIRSNTGWDLRVSEGLQETAPPSDEELRLLRERVDPEGKFIKGKLVL